MEPQDGNPTAADLDAYLAAVAEEQRIAELTKGENDNVREEPAE